MDFGAAETALTIEVANIGTGSLTWSAKSDKDWLAFEPPTETITTGKSPLIVKAERGNLPPATYTATITIISPEGGNLELKAQMAVLENPVLSLSETGVDFGATGETVTLEIKNTGTGALKWEVTEEVEWLSTTPTKGETSRDADKLTLKASRRYLAPDTYTATVKVMSNGGNRTIVVKLTKLPEPALQVEKKAVVFAESAEIASLIIKNVGTGILEWSVATQQGWISFDKQAGATPENSEDSLAVKVKRENLPPGQHPGAITITSNGGTEEISVTMMIAPEPELYISHRSLDLGDDKEVLTLTIKNIGTGLLNWNLTVDQPWVSLIPEGDKTEVEKEVEVTVKVNRENLPPNSYEAVIEVKSNGGNEKVMVRMTKLPQPVLMVDPSTLKFDESADIQTVFIKNIGTGVLAWETSTESDWISVQPNSGQVSAAGESEVKVQVERTGLPPQNYTGALNVTSNGGKEGLAVTMTVAPNPILAISPTTLNFETAQEKLPLTIQNKGTGNLDWELETGVPWLTFRPANGRVREGEESAILVEVNRNLLDLGEHSTPMPIISNATNSVALRVIVSKRGKIEGSVVDARTGLPVVKASVLLDGSAQTSTDESGRFSFAIQTDGTYDIRTSKPGYLGRLRQVTTLRGMAEPVDILLKPLPKVVRTIKDNANPFQSPTWIAINPAQTRAFVTNQSDDTVSVIDTFTDTVVKKIPVGREPLGLVANPQPAISEVYVANSRSDNVSVIDTVEDKESKIPVGKVPVDLAISPDGGTLYVVNRADASISIVSVEGRKQVDSIRLKRTEPEAITITPDGIYLYVAHFRDGIVAVIDTRFKNEVAASRVGSEPAAITTNSSGKYVYAVNSFDDSMSIIDTASNVALPPLKTAPGAGVAGIAVITGSDGGDLVYLTHVYTANIVLIEIPADISQYQKSDSAIDVGLSPKGIAILKDGEKIYVANSADNSISVLQY